MVVLSLLPKIILRKHRAATGTVGIIYMAALIIIPIITIIILAIIITTGHITTTTETRLHGTLTII